MASHDEHGFAVDRSFFQEIERPVRLGQGEGLGPRANRDLGRGFQELLAVEARGCGDGAASRRGCHSLGIRNDYAYCAHRHRLDHRLAFQ